MSSTRVVCRFDAHDILLAIGLLDKRLESSSTSWSTLVILDMDPLSDLLVPMKRQLQS